MKKNIIICSLIVIILFSSFNLALEKIDDCYDITNRIFVWENDLKRQRELHPDVDWSEMAYIISKMRMEELNCELKRDSQLKNFEKEIENEINELEKEIEKIYEENEIPIKEKTIEKDKEIELVEKETIKNKKETNENNNEINEIVFNIEDLKKELETKYKQDFEKNNLVKFEVKDTEINDLQDINKLLERKKKEIQKLYQNYKNNNLDYNELKKELQNSKNDGKNILSKLKLFQGNFKSYNFELSLELNKYDKLISDLKKKIQNGELNKNMPTRRKIDAIGIVNKDPGNRFKIMVQNVVSQEQLEKDKTKINDCLGNQGNSFIAGGSAFNEERCSKLADHYGNSGARTGVLGWTATKVINKEKIVKTIAAYSERLKPVVAVLDQLGLGLEEGKLTSTINRQIGDANVNFKLSQQGFEGLLISIKDKNTRLGKLALQLGYTDESGSFVGFTVTK